MTGETERIRIGDLDDAYHETCMLARWDALLEWLDAQQVEGRVERELAAPAGERRRGLGLDRLFANLQPTSVPDLPSSGPVRALGNETAERARRECGLVGKYLQLTGRDWVVRVIDHLASDAELVEAGGSPPPPPLRRWRGLVILFEAARWPVARGRFDERIVAR